MSEQALAPSVVRVTEDGPLEVQAEVLRVNGVAVESPQWLCRCGASQNKPFCDSSHRRIAFSDGGEALAKDSTVVSVTGGALDVTTQRNGPLRISGAQELRSHSGRVLARVTETFLCRCGASHNKPWCDGSHKRNGFSAL